MEVTRKVCIFVPMMRTERQQAAAAAEFAKRWKGRGYEKGDSQVFWTELLTEVYGVENPSTFIRYEEQVKVDKTNFIDGHIQKSLLNRNHWVRIYEKVSHKVTVQFSTLSSKPNGM